MSEGRVLFLLLLFLLKMRPSQYIQSICMTQKEQLNLCFRVLDYYLCKEDVEIVNSSYKPKSAVKSVPKKNLRHSRQKMKHNLNNPELNEIRRKYQAVTCREKRSEKVKEKTFKQLYKKWEENSNSE